MLRQKMQGMSNCFSDHITLSALTGPFELT